MTAYECHLKKCTLPTDKSFQRPQRGCSSRFFGLLFVFLTLGANLKQPVCYCSIFTKRHICFDILAVIHGKSPEEIYSNVAPVMVNHFLFCCAQMAGHKTSISRTFFQKT